MSQKQNGNGNGNGIGALLLQPHKKPATAMPPPEALVTEENGVTFRTSEENVLRATPLRIQRHAAVFELYSPNVALHLSEVLSDFTVTVQSRRLYSGRAVVRNIVDSGTSVHCEAKLDESGWVQEATTIAQAFTVGNLASEFKNFLSGWQKSYNVLPEFKIAIADLQMIFMELRLWLDKIEVEIQSQPVGVRSEIEKLLIHDLQDYVLSTVGHLLEKFELVAERVSPDARPAHIAFLQQQIHPFVLSAPFINRTFNKPLGYAGDYEMVNMMVRNPYEGQSLFAKMLNFIFLSTPPVRAHRSRITYLTRMLLEETARARGANPARPVRFLNLGCGPAKEIQDFLTNHHVCDSAEFLLLDFNDETLNFTGSTLSRIKQVNERSTKIDLTKKSVQQILKEAARLDYLGKFDVVYCAGLFDYLTDEVSARLLQIFYSLARPGGLVAATNVADTNPSRGWMEYALDWHLIYRSVDQFRSLVPAEARSDAVVRAIGDGVNIAVEMRKPTNV
jgi:extracellular factor (EF) 3-hydroxypalmitic acid methyl ester biosynthesis protein